MTTQTDNRSNCMFADSPSGAATGACARPCNGVTTHGTDHEQRLTWLTLQTTPRDINQALHILFEAALGETRDAQRAGLLLLGLWHSDRYPLDLNDLSYAEQRINTAARHLINFVVACGVSLRQLVTAIQIQPIVHAWGEGR